MNKKSLSLLLLLFSNNFIITVKASDAPPSEITSEITTNKNARCKQIYIGTMLTFLLIIGIGALATPGIIEEVCTKPYRATLLTCCPDVLRSVPENINVTSVTINDAVTKMNITGQCGGGGTFRDFATCENSGLCAPDSPFLRALLRRCDNVTPCTQHVSLPQHTCTNILAKCTRQQANSLQRSNSTRGQLPRYPGR
jgi:hypothetical protein